MVLVHQASFREEQRLVKSEMRRLPWPSPHTPLAWQHLWTACRLQHCQGKVDKLVTRRSSTTLSDPAGGRPAWSQFALTGKKMREAIHTLHRQQKAHAHSPVSAKQAVADMPQAVHAYTLPLTQSQQPARPCCGLPEVSHGTSRRQRARGGGGQARHAARTRSGLGALKAAGACSKQSKMWGRWCQRSRRRSTNSVPGSEAPT